MEEKGFIFQAFIYLLAAVVSVPVAKRLGLGSILGYLIAGMLIGPFVLGLVGQEGQDVMHFAEFGVVLMLFLIGLELKPALLWKMRLSILGLGSIQVGLSALLITGIGLFAGLVWNAALAIGLSLALSSTAIVMQSLSEKGLTTTSGGRNAFSVLLFQDIAVIPFLAVIPLLAAGTPQLASGYEEAWIQTLPLWAHTLVVLLVMTAIVVGGKYLMGPLFRFIASTHLREIFIATALLLVIGVALLMESIGISAALGTFVAGVVLAQNEYRHEIEADIEPFKGLLLGLFFIAVGASVDFALIASEPLLIAILVVVLMLVKFLILFAIGRLFQMGWDNNFLFSFSLAQGGEFAFVLLSFAVQNRVVEVSTANLLIVVVAITMALTPLAMLVNEKFIQPRFGTRTTESPDDLIDEENPVIIAGFGRFGNIVGRFLRANNIGSTFLDTNADNVELLRKMGIKVFYGDASRLDLLKAAGADKARILIVAVGDDTAAEKIINLARKNFPKLHIMVRTKRWSDTYNILDLGIEDVYRETLDTSLRMGVDAMVQLGFRSRMASRAARKFREHDEENVREQARIRHDHKELVNTVKQNMEEIENMMRKDIEDAQHDKDLGWDPDSRRSEFANRSPLDAENQDA